MLTRLTHIRISSICERLMSTIPHSRGENKRNATWHTRLRMFLVAQFDKEAKSGKNTSNFQLNGIVCKQVPVPKKAQRYPILNYIFCMSRGILFQKTPELLSYCHTAYPHYFFLVFADVAPFCSGRLLDWTVETYMHSSVGTF